MCEERIECDLCGDSAEDVELVECSKCGLKPICVYCISVHKCKGDISAGG